ncbi:MAG: 23S rRNA (adenine(2503)-C(2))-methyltransferase RlmN [Erysipelotrichaceae bacterium]|nr:23S rRNA (adenine(2503)-C(2))-methyltransferase RlmN [Erysipelotrichaceae bacterium]
MKSIYDFTREKLEEFFIGQNEKKFKATQVYEWLYKKRISSFEEMQNISKTTIQLLKENFLIDKLNLLASQSDVDVDKYLFELKDQNKIEAVLMHHDYGYSLCISTEVGCNMGCLFCESGRLKKVRNLEVSEMVLQILQIEKLKNVRISHVVLMGIGEPFDNYDNVIDFIKVINDPKGIDLGARHITISTCGLVPKIKEFMELNTQVNLAVSLHAPNNYLRDKIMPINKAYKIEELMEAIKAYIKKTNRRVTFEYIMLKDLNDTKGCALELAKLLKGINCYVNLIPYNRTSAHDKFGKSDKETILKFYDILKKNNINVTIRREFGSKVMAACGQLRANYEEEK